MARSISVVLLKAKVSDGTVSLATAFRRLFAFTEPIVVQNGSSTEYASGNFRHTRAPNVLSAQVRPVRQMAGVKSRFDQRDGYKLAETELTQVSEAVATVAMDPETGVVALWERASFPYTRLISYVKRAHLKHDVRWRLELTPVLTEKSIADWLAHFDEINQITLEYQHSQSPGDEVIDEMIDGLNAKWVKQTVTAKKGESLNVEGIEGTLLAHSVNHLDRNKKNGRGILDGKLDGERLVIDTSNPVERQRVELEDGSPDAVVVLLAAVIRNMS